MSFRSTPMRDCPCKKDCPERSADCHGKCQRYKDWRVVQDARNEAERNANKARYTLNEDKKRELWRKKRYSVQCRFSNSTAKSDR